MYLIVAYCSRTLLLAANLGYSFDINKKLICFFVLIPS